MAAEPSLSEITSIRGDAAVGSGTAGVGGNLAQLPADYQGIQVLQNAAVQKAAANKYAIESYREDLKNNLQSFNNLDVSGIMEKDRSAIIPDYLNLMRDLYQNYDAVADPLKNPDKYQELKNKEADLRTKIASSKQDLLMRTKASEFLNQHPTFQTQDSKDKIRRFSDGDLGTRNVDDVLNFTPGWDFKQQTISTLANAAAQKKTTEQEATKPFITKTERTEYETQAYLDAVKAMIGGTDEYGRVIKNGIQEQFDKLPEQAKAQFKQADGTYNVDNYAESLYLPLKAQSSSSKTIDENQFALNDQTARQRMAEAAQQAKLLRQNYEFQKKFDDKDYDNLGAEIGVRQLSVFTAPDKQGAQVERIPPPNSNNAPADWSKPLSSLQNNFGLEGDKNKVMEGVPLPLDAWLVNAYSIPDKTRTSYDPVTGALTDKDSYRRPEAAWVTTEKNPDARKVVVRYKDEESGATQDLVLPYSEHFQILNNIAGDKNAIKLGGAKAKLMKRLTGKVNPGVEDLFKVSEFTNPNATEPVVAQPVLPSGVSAAGGSPTSAPANTTTGGFILNADEFLKSKKIKK